MGTQSDFRVKKNLIVGDGTISSESGNLVLRRDFDDSDWNQITLGDDTYKITLSNDDRFYIDSDGKVGIGTTSPKTTLHVSDGSTSGLSGASSASLLITDDTNPRIYFEDLSEGAGDRVFGIKYESEYLSFDSLNDAASSYDTQNIMTVHRDGKVGIGTASADEILDVRSATTPKLLVRTTATSSQEAHIIIGGARTTSTTADISRVIFNTYDDDINGSESNTLAEITVRKQAASGDQGNLLFKTNSGNDSISEAMRIDKDGNVGIGTDNPSEKLEVAGSILIDYALAHRGDTNNQIVFSSADTQTYKTAGLDRMTIASDGNVGIGTTSPDKWLHINTQLSSGGEYALILERPNGFDTAAVGIDFQMGDSLSATAGHSYAHLFGVIEDRTNNSEDGALTFWTSLAGTTAEKMRITSSGNVGIGTASPVPMFHVKANNGTTDMNSAGAAGITIEQDGAGDAAFSMLLSGTRRWMMGIDNSDSDKLKFATGGTSVDSGTALTIDTSGNVGIGNTNPSSPLDVTGSIELSSNLHFNGSGGHYIKHEGGTTASDMFIFRFSNNEDVMTVAGDGQVGIGTTAPGYMLDIQGSNAKINLKDTDDTDDMCVRFAGNDGNEYALVGYGGTSVFQIKSPQGRVINLGGHANTKVGITTADMTFTPTALLHVNGSFKATTKSFDIEHPTKEGMRLHHGALEGPEHGVYIRGHVVGDTIELPDYWLGLVDEDTITVQLTANGRSQNPYVKSVDREKVMVGGFTNKPLDFYYFIQAERKDVSKVEVEYGSIH